jgi:hypothetical protein
VFTAWYALGPYIKQIRFVFKGLTCEHQRIRKYKLSTKHKDIRPSNTTQPVPGKIN